MLVTLFDPWKSRLCTCPRKYSLNPYTGCSHACVYCYITSYIPRGHTGRAKQDLIKRLKRELPKLDRNIPIAMSNSSDPYQPLEAELRLTRRVLKLLLDFKVLIVTKGSLVARDIDILSNMASAVSMTITTLDDETAEKLEPHAPLPEDRLRALQRLVSAGIPTSVRVDPIIPGVNEEVEPLIKELADIGVRHITSSTFKPRPDSWRRFSQAFPHHSERLRELYFEKGEKIQNSWYLPADIRRKLMERVRKACEKYGLSFATCREGLNLNTARSCDGSHLILCSR